MNGDGSITGVGTEMQSYYGRPILKEPVWQPEVPCYFFTGGIAGASSVLHLLAKLQEAGVETAQLYGADRDDGVGGFGAFFLLLDEPEVYGLPPDPVVPTKHLGESWAAAFVAGAALVASALGAFLGSRR